MNIAIVSDGHEGDYCGLWLPSYSIEGGKWKPNRAQQYLNRCWDDAMKWLPEQIDITFLNGDAVAGENPVEQGGQLVTTEIPEQVGCAAERLKQLRERSKQFRVLRGTPYHEGKKTSAAEPLGERLGADKWKNGKSSGWWYCKEHWGYIIDVAHTMPQALVYTSTMLEREGGWARRRDMTGKPIIIIRSHLHHFDKHETNNTYEVLTPCWQMQTPYAIRKSPNKLIPDLGLVLIQITEGDKENGVNIKKHLYKHPMWHTE